MLCWGWFFKKNVQTKREKNPPRFRLYAPIMQIHAKSRAVVWASPASAGDNGQKEWRRGKKVHVDSLWPPPPLQSVWRHPTRTHRSLNPKTPHRTGDLSEASGTSACLRQVRPCISGESHTFVEGQTEASSMKKSVSEWKCGMDGLHHWQSYITLKLSGFWVDWFLSAPCLVPLKPSK